MDTSKIEENIKNCLKQFNKKEKAQIIPCLEYSKKHLTSLKRHDGTNYFIHSIEKLKILCEVTTEVSFIRLGLLHDILEHPNGKNLLEKSPLTKEEKVFIKQINSLRKLKLDRNKSDLNRVVNTFIQDPRFMILRTAHRLNDIRNVNRFPKNYQKKIAKETLYIYTSLAGRMGLHAWRYEMEDRSFKTLHPIIAKRIEAKYQEAESIDEICLAQTVEYLKDIFKKKKIKVKIETRIKSLFSTYRKMLLKKKKFNELNDRLAIRLITETIPQCYRILGIVHTNTHPIRERLKDYIGSPKENGYQSIHTGIYPMPGITERPIEIQIRTHTMHFECEYGIAAHFKYKDTNYLVSSARHNVDVFRNLKMLKMEENDPKNFKKAITNYLHKKNIIIFDNQNNIYYFKKPTTALDFAIIVYDKKFTKIKTIKVNGLEKNFDNLLEDGDVVEVAFKRENTINKNWKKYCYRKRSLKLITSFLKAKKID
jgi:GTP pyrophosphokinase